MAIHNRPVLEGRAMVPGVRASAHSGTKCPSQHMPARDDHLLR